MLYFIVFANIFTLILLIDNRTWIVESEFNISICEETYLNDGPTGRVSPSIKISISYFDFVNSDHEIRMLNSDFVI